MTAKVGRSEWDSHLINQYRQERDEARAELENLQNGRISDARYIDQLQTRIDELETRLRYALAALEAVEFSSWYYDDYSCPWCKNTKFDGHSPTCQRQLVLQMEPLEVGEK